MAALPAALDVIAREGGRATVHVNPGMFNERGVRLNSGTVIPVANVPSPQELEWTAPRSSTARTRQAGGRRLFAGRTVE